MRKDRKCEWKISNECLRKKGRKEDKDEDGDRWGGARVQAGKQAGEWSVYGAQKATCTSHRDEEKLQQAQKLLPAKKVHKNSKHSCNMFSISLSPSPTLFLFRFPLHLLFSISIFSPLFHVSHTPAYTHSPPTLHFLHLFTSLSPSLLSFCSAFTLLFSLQHFSGRELGPSLGCCWPGLLAAK